MRRVVLAAVILAAAVAVSGGRAYAHTSAEVKKKCPLCDTEFKARMDMSGTEFGMRLDLKPLGAISAPWAVAVCPKCRFVLFDKDIDDKTLEKCRKIVATKEYKKHTKRASYYLIGLLFEGLGEDDLNCAHTFLKASWQEEADEKNLKEDLGKSLKYFQAYSKNAKKHDKAWETAQILIGESMRRMGQFKEAKTHFDKVAKMKEFQGTFLEKIVKYQLKLIAGKDWKPHAIADMND